MVRMSEDSETSLCCPSDSHTQYFTDHRHSARSGCVSWVQRRTRSTLYSYQCRCQPSHQVYQGQYIILVSLTYHSDRQEQKAHTSRYLQASYVENACYPTATSLIKIAILLQFRRIFTGNSKRYQLATRLMLIATALWGIIFSFVCWFPVFPVNAFWDLTIVTTVRYGIGSLDPTSFTSTYVALTATNMVLDLLILSLPVPYYLKSSLSWKSRSSLLGLFLLGSVYVFSSSSICTVSVTPWSGSRHEAPTCRPLTVRRSYLSDLTCLIPSIESTSSPSSGSSASSKRERAPTQPWTPASTAVHRWSCRPSKSVSPPSPPRCPSFGPLSSKTWATFSSPTKSRWSRRSTRTGRRAGATRCDGRTRTCGSRRTYPWPT